MVLIIWAVIAYKLFKYVMLDKSPIHDIMLYKQKAREVSPDTFILNLNYRDPFLEIEMKRTVKQNQQFKVSIKDFSAMKMKFPDIIYYGIVTNKNCNKTIASLIVSGKELIVHIGSCFEELSITSIYKDSIAIMFKGSRKIILKEK